MRLRTDETKTYDIGDGFRMDIVFYPEASGVEAFIYHEDYGVKSLVCGATIGDGEDFANFFTVKTINEFLVYLKHQCWHYKKEYELEYMD